MDFWPMTMVPLRRSASEWAHVMKSTGLLAASTMRAHARLLVAQRKSPPKKTPGRLLLVVSRTRMVCPGVRVAGRLHWTLK